MKTDAAFQRWAVAVCVDGRIRVYTVIVRNLEKLKSKIAKLRGLKPDRRQMSNWGLRLLVWMAAGVCMDVPLCRRLR